MDLRQLEPHDVDYLADQYSRERLLVLEQVRLPRVFQPDHSDVVFLDTQAGCEVYLDARVRYRGGEPSWQQLLERDPDPGGTRRILQGAADFPQAVLALLGALDDAAVPAPQPQPERPAREPAAGDPQLRDLVLEAAEAEHAPPWIGREDELRSLITNLLRESKPGVVLCGPAGVGKTTVVKMLAARMAEEGRVPAALRDLPLYDLQLGGLLENARVVGDIERQVRELLEQPGRPIFFVDEIHQLTRPELAPLRDLLKPALAEGSLRMIGATTPVEWRRVKDAAFKRRFMELNVPAPSPEDTFRMLTGRVEALARHHGLAFGEDTLREAIMLADRYLPARHFPDKAIDLLDQAAAMQRTEQEASEAEAALERAWLVEATASHSGLDRALLDATASGQRVEDTVAMLRERLLGQDPAFDQIAATLRTRCSMGFVGWRQALETLRPTWDRRPLATFLACGPTGVGKTETARVLSEAFFGGRMITLNGSEVGPEAPHGIAMWTGSPPGYVGSDQGGVLTNGLRTHGTALILVDELEKASPEAVQNVLLPLLGDGTVSDRNTGETLVAADCIVFCTSNIPLEEPARAALGFGDQAPVVEDGWVARALQRYLRAEIVGRFNRILRYRGLELDTRLRIWDSLQQQLAQRVGEGSSFTLDDDAQALVRQRLAGLESGARGIRDLFREWMLPLAVQASPGEDTPVTSQDGRLVTAEPPEPESP